MKSPFLRKSSMVDKQDTTSTTKNDSSFMTSIRSYMKLFKQVVDRQKGEKLCIVKFHQLLHFQKYVKDHGVPSNFDGS